MNTRTNEELLEMLRVDVESAEAGVISHTDIMSTLRELESRVPNKNSSIRQRAERLHQRYRSAAR